MKMNDRDNQILDLRQQGLTFEAIGEQVGLKAARVHKICTNENVDNRQILVTGGFGFIGGHLLARLLADPRNHVHVVDNLSSAPLPVERLLSDLNYPLNLTYTIDSIASFLRMDTRHDWYSIYHLASPVGPAGVLKYAGSMAKLITEDIYGLIQLALQSRCRLIDVSTSEIYGGGEAGLCAENMPRIISPNCTVRLEYAVGKLAAETMIFNSVTVHGLDAVIIRPFNVSGPRQSGKGGFVLPRFIAQAMTGNPLTVFGDGLQVRAFTHVEDIVSGIILAAQKAQSGSAYNIGNPGNHTTILALAEMVIAYIGRGEIQFVDPKAIYGPLYAEAADKYPDATKAMQELNWKPIKTIVDTIRSTHLYMTWSSPEDFERLAGFHVEYDVWQGLSVNPHAL